MISKHSGFCKFHSRFRDLREDEVIERLKEDKRTFFCGSRYFKEKYEANRWMYGDCDFSTVDDWDFSIKVGEIPEKELRELGFKRQILEGDHIEMYGDYSFVFLWKHKDYKVDLVERYAFDYYKKVWSNVGVDFYYKYLWKSAPHRDKAKVGEHKEFIRDWLNQALLQVGY